MANITSNRWGESDTDPLADLQRAIKQLSEVPPAPFLASSRIFKTEGFIHFKRDGRDYVAGHPDQWAKVPEAAAPFPGSMFRIEIVDLDVNEERRAAFFAAMARPADGES